jgi:glycosyltransferase involved in cell wall biosynthesis
MTPESRPHVLQVFERPTGGVPVYVAGLCEGLTARGWRVSVSCPVETSVDARLAGSGVERLTTRSPLELARHVRATGISLVHAHSTRAGPMAALVAQLSRRPLVYTPHGWSFEMRVGRTRRTVYAATELVLTRALKRQVIAVAGVERSAAERWHVAPTDRIAVVSTGIPAPERAYERAVARSVLGLEDSRAVAAWVGRAGEQKRPQDLPAIAAALAPDGVRIVALGSGLRASAAGRALESAGGLLLAEDTDPQALYAAADILVQTSAWEGMPLALLEAMSAGLPIVAYDVGGVSEVVLHGETGYCVAVGDVGALAACVRMLATNHTLRRRMAESARAHVAEHHSFDGFLDGIEREYRRCLSVGSTPGKGG